MRDPGVPCQLEFFGEFDFSEPGAGTKESSPTAVEAAAEDSGQPTPAPATDWLAWEVELTRQASRLAAELGAEEIARRVTVRWNPRMRTAAGRAFYEGMRVELNPGLAVIEGIDTAAEIDRTLRHELAHLVAHFRAGGRRVTAHGAEWRQVCAELGIADESRCHNLPFQSRRVPRKLAYECPACGYEILRVRRFRQTVACYDCCRKHSGGRYDDRFRLVGRRLPDAG